MRTTVHGITDVSLFWRDFAIMAALSAALAILSAWLYTVIDRAVRINAALEVC